MMITCKYPKWLDAEEVKVCVDAARRVFKKHKAKVRVNDKRFLILDWANKDPVYAGYDFHYVFDKKQSRFMVYGDYMDGMARWVEPIDLKGLIQCMCDKKKFVHALELENMQIFQFEYNNALKDLKETKGKAMGKAEEAGDNMLKAKISEDFSYMYDFIDEYGSNAPYNGSFTGLWMKYNTEIPADLVGKRLIYPVYIWVMGFLLACDKAGLIKLKMS